MSKYNRIKKNTYLLMVYVGLLTCPVGCGESESEVKSEVKEQIVMGDKGGIPNIGGVTCYMNSVLQIFAKLYPHAFEGKQSTLAQAFRKIAEKIKYDQEDVAREEAQAVYNALLTEGQKQNSVLQKDKQEDAQQAFSLLFAAGLFDRNKIQQSTGNVDADEINYRRKVRSEYPYIQKVFFASSSPQTRSEPVEAITLLPLSLYKQSTPTMQGLFDNYLKSDSTLKRKFGSDLIVDTTLTKKLNNLHKLPNHILPIHVLRFEQNEQKIDTSIQHPDRLVVKKEKTVEGTSDLHYKLAGFIVHQGTTIHGGHYVAYIKSNGVWKQYNDSVTTVEGDGAIENAAKRAYLYFYKRAS